MDNQEQRSFKMQMNDLIIALQKWDYEYYILNNPSVDDGIYDQKLQELKELEAKSSIVLANSPTFRLNSKIYKQSKFKLVRRSVPMLSIDSTTSKEGLFAFDKRVRKEIQEATLEYLCELKIDGLSASIKYENYKLVQLSTRGNGIFGEDVTFNQEVITNLPLQLPNKEVYEVRGEVYMRKQEFLTLNEELNRKGVKKLANARNAAAGTLRTLAPNKERKLRFSAYQYFGNGSQTQEECLQKLGTDGFEVGEYRLCKSIEEVVTYTEEITKRRDAIDFAVDGVVVKVNQYPFHKKLGETSRFPRWAIAYKFTPLAAISIVKVINRAVSKNGRITYVAVVDKVTIAGSVIENVTLHNFAFIEKKKLGIGDEVLIKKAGDVIPQVAEVLKKQGSPWQAPPNCPSCSSELLWRNDYLYQLCPNNECSERNISYLAFFASKTAINIKGVSRSIIEKLYKLELVRKPYDFYDLASKRDELQKVQMFEKKSIDNLLSAIDRSRYKNFADFITAFSIPLLSSIKARKLAMIFNENVEEFLIFIRKKESFTFLKTELGIKTGSAVECFFRDQNNLRNFERTSLQMIFVKAV